MIDDWSINLPECDICYGHAWSNDLAAHPQCDDEGVIQRPSVGQLGLYSFTAY